MIAEVKQLLLIIRDPELRQLYHEILLCDHWEVLVADDVANAFMQIISNKVSLVIIQEDENISVKKFIQLLVTKPEWQKLKIIIFDYDESFEELKIISSNLLEIHLKSSLQLTPGELLSYVKQLV